MIERSGDLPDDVEELKAMALATSARADLSDAEAARSEVLELKAEVNDLAETNAMAKAEIARLTSILKTLRRGRFGRRPEKLGADEAEQQSFAFEEVETGLEAIATRLAAKSEAGPRKTPRDKPRFPSHLERVEEVLEPEVPPAFEGKERAGSAGGGRTWAAVATMLQTCKMNGAGPYAWAKLNLERIANRWPNNDIDALMPRNFRPLA